MDHKTPGNDKLRTTSTILRPIAIVGVTLGLAFVFGACSGGDSGSDPDPGGDSKVLDTGPLRTEQAPDGLEDRSGDALIAILQEDPSYDDYVALLQASGVSEDLATTDGLTVFAPLNEGIQRQADLLDPLLAPGDLDSFLAEYEDGRLPELDDRDGLAELLRRGIASGELTPDRIRPGLRLDPLEGSPLVITGRGETLAVSGVEFDEQAGVFAANGALYPAGGLIEP